jgi:hypothetical protein
MARSVTHQLETLRRLLTPRSQQRTLLGCLSVIILAIAGLVVASHFLGGWAFIPFILFLIILGLGLAHSSREIAPRLRDARQALDCYEAVSGRVRMVVTQDSDSYDYQAGVRDRQGNDWTFDFSPQDWLPETGDHAAELRYIEGVEWPTLIVTEAGVLYPKSVPKRAALALPEAEAPVPQRPLPYYLGGAISLLLGGLILAGAWGAYLKDSGIVANGLAVDAVVVKTGYLVAKPGERHGLLYRFTLPDGRVIERAWTEEDDLWRSHPPGSTLRVHYAADDPARNFPVGKGSTSLGMALFVSAFGLVFLFFAGLLLVSGYRHQSATKHD